MQKNCLASVEANSGSDITGDGCLALIQTGPLTPRYKQGTSGKFLHYKYHDAANRLSPSDGR